MGRPRLLPLCVLCCWCCWCEKEDTLLTLSDELLLTAVVGMGKKADSIIAGGCGEEKEGTCMCCRTAELMFSSSSLNKLFLVEEKRA